MAEANRADCPQCGHELQRWPTLESSGHLLACDACGYEQVVSADPEPDPSDPDSHTTSAPEISTGRLKQLMAQTDPNQWPEELLEDLPEEARQQLQSKPSQDKPEVTADMQQRLRGYGYVLAEDGSGARLSGEGPKPGTGDLSPLDVVRLAAEMEGGTPAQGEKMICPSCQAVLPSKSQHCQWCGHKLSDKQPGAGE